ncbi:MAG: lysophospholipid acyltransferase family protein, partial [Thermoguttaceae bacterium]|nr:lysophospholipid acyltransferase family protein [Thermoguttaceae bacterium]
MKKRPSKIVDYSVYLVVRIVICVVQSLSLDVCRRGAEALAFLFNDVLRARGKLVDANLYCAFPELSARERKDLSRRMWRHLFLMVAEVALAPRRLNQLNWWKHVKLERPFWMLHALHDDRPLILITGHFGNFEMGGYTLGVLGYPTFSVARKLDNPYLDAFIRDFRGTTGQFIIDKNEGYEDILTVLKHNGTMAFLADQSAGPKGAWIDFFGRPASAFKAPTLLSLQYDAPIIVCAATRRDEEPMNFALTNLATLDPRNLPPDVRTVKEITQWHASKMEEAIRKYPDQYWWLHNRW